MFTRSTVKSTRDKIQAVLSTLSEELGCQIKVGNATFDRNGSNCTFKVECATISSDGIAETKEVSAFRDLAALYGLSADDLGKPFVDAGERFVISGLAQKSRRFPILAKREKDGKGFKFAADNVKLALLAREV